MGLWRRAAGFELDTLSKARSGTMRTGSVGEQFATFQTVRGTF
jgi:hypothetical protein